jgi:hypothetical protein
VRVSEYFDRGHPIVENGTSYWQTPAGTQCQYSGVDKLNNFCAGFVFHFTEYFTTRAFPGAFEIAPECECSGRVSRETFEVTPRASNVSATSFDHHQIGQ